MMRLISYIIAVVILGSATSCEHKDLCYDHNHMLVVDVVFDWRNASEASPESMVLYLYDREGGDPLRYIFTGRDGGRISVPYGTYDALCMNSDNTDWAFQRNTSDIEAFETYTDDAASLAVYGIETATLPRARGSEGERMAKSPGMLWGDRQDGFELRYTDTGRKEVKLYPSEQVCHYTVDILDVENIESMDGMTLDGTLSGMAEGFVHGQNCPSGVKVTVPFKLTADNKARSMHAEFLTFGQCHEAADDMLTVYTYLIDGNKWYYTFNVTDQVHGAADPHHVHIVVRGLSLPKSVAVGGMQPVVDEWQTVHVDLPMDI